MDVIAGAKVHYGICCFLEEAGKASYSWYDLFSFYSFCNALPTSCPPVPQWLLPIMFHAFSTANKCSHQAGSTPSRLVPPRSFLLSPLTGSTPVLPLSPVMSISARLSALAVSEKFTAQLATAVRAHPTTSMPLEALTARLCKHWRRLAS